MRKRYFPTFCELQSSQIIGNTKGFYILALNSHKRVWGWWAITEGFPGGSDGLKKKKSTCNAGDLGSLPSWEDPLEEDMATHSSILAWETAWAEEPGGLQSMGSQRVRHDWATNTFTFDRVRGCPTLKFQTVEQLQSGFCLKTELYYMILPSLQLCDILIVFWSAKEKKILSKHLRFFHLWTKDLLPFSLCNWPENQLCDPQLDIRRWM